MTTLRTLNARRKRAKSDAEDQKRAFPLELCPDDLLAGVIRHCRPEDALSMALSSPSMFKRVHTLVSRLLTEVSVLKDSMRFMVHVL